MEALLKRWGHLGFLAGTAAPGCSLHCLGEAKRRRKKLKPAPLFRWFLTFCTERSLKAFYILKKEENPKPKNTAPERTLLPFKHSYGHTAKELGATRFAWMGETHLLNFSSWVLASGCTRRWKQQQLDCCPKWPHDLVSHHTAHARLFLTHLKTFWLLVPCHVQRTHFLHWLERACAKWPSGTLYVMSVICSLHSHVSQQGFCEPSVRHSAHTQ